MVKVAAFASGVGYERTKSNYKTTKDILKTLNARKAEVADILRRCKIEGVLSVHNMRYELANGLQLGAIYNLEDEELKGYLHTHYGYKLQ